jgi:uncharacterized membrane protein
MRKFSWILFGLLLVASVAFLTTTTPQLPLRVASHFGGDNLANGWMTRDGYLRFMLGLGVLLPVVLAALTALLPRMAAGFVNLPNRDYWMAPARRAETLSRLSSHGAWFGSLMCGFFMALHWILLKANAAVPPQLPQPEFWIVLGAFVLAIAAWIARLAKRFRNVD